MPHEEASEVASVVTVSIGIVDSDGTVPMETLIARADSALYQQ
jgi:PleD family two-component response regulator